MRDHWIKILMLAGAMAGLTVEQSAAQISLVTTGAVWRYLDTGVSQATGWVAPGFDDASWPSGAAPLGYSTDGDTEFQTVISFGSDDQNKYPTYYFRSAFTVADASSITNLRAYLRRDDGAVIYINGTEVVRENMPEGEIAYDTLALGTLPDDGAALDSFPIDLSLHPGLLTTGNANVLAVEVHQVNATSSDLVFDLGLVGNPQPEVEITSPADGATIEALNLQVRGVAIPGGAAIDQIEVFANGTLIGTSTSSDFSVNWLGVTPGSYTLTATITDSSGLTATSDPVGITVEPPPTGTLVAPGSLWKYFLGTQEASVPSTLWRQIQFSDSGWSSGGAPLGYGESDVVTTLPTSQAANYVSVYLRHTFQVANPGSFEQLVASVTVDDGAVAFLNGQEIGRINVPAGELLYNDVAIAAEERRTLDVTIDDPSGILVAGNNVFAIHLFNANLTSSDLLVEAELRGTVDLAAPFVTRVFPPETATVRELIAIEILFSEAVTGVDAGDLLINGVAAASLTILAPDQYRFEFPSVAAGPVQVAWRADNGITDLAGSPNPFLGGSWTYTVDPDLEPPTVIISEFVASNNDSLNDEDGDSSDWIELYNAGSVSASLDGWYLTDDRNELNKWRIPGVVLLPGEFIIVFASNKDRANPTQPLHANFTLRAGGEDLLLVDPDLNVISGFYGFPQQYTDVSYGRDLLSPDLVGYFEETTPNAPNANRGRNFAPEVVYSEPSRTFSSNFNLELSTPDDPTAQIRYVLVTDAASAATTNVPTQASPLYVGPIPVTDTVQVRARAFSLSPEVFPGPPSSQSYVKINANLVSFTSDLPLVLMHNFGGGAFPGGYPALDESTIFMVFDTKFGRSSLTNIPDVATRSGINLRGSSTQGFPKGSYAVEFWDEYNDDQDIEVLGMPEESDWVLYSPNQFDISLIHNPIAFELSNDVGEYAARTRMVEVFLDTNGGEVSGPVPGGAYNGVYVLMEKLKRNSERVAIDRLEPEHLSAPEVTGGYLMKVDRQDANERSFSAGGLTIIYVEPDGLLMVTPQRTAQANYIRDYVNTMYTAIQGNNYADYINVRSFIDHNLLNMLPINVDAMRLSGYFNKPRDIVDRYGNVIERGKFRMGPVWDYDRSQGTTRGDIANGRPWSPIAWMGQDPGGGDPGTAFFDQNVVFANPWYRNLFRKIDFWQAYVDRYQELRDGPFSTNHIFAIIDRLGNELAEAQVREVARWGGNGASDTRPRTGTINQFGYAYTFDGTYQGEINFQKKWYADRVYFIDTQFLARPVFNMAGGEVPAGTQVTLTGPAGSTVYYTLDGTDPRAPGGNPAPGALSAFGTATITVNNNAYVFARSYNPNHSNMTGTSPNTVINPILSTRWSGWRKASYVVNMPTLRITELMYHPLPADPATSFFDDDFEYVEVQNIGQDPLNLQGFRLGGAVDFVFPNRTLAAGQTAVIASHLPGYAARYGTNGIVLLGQYTRVLSNDREEIVLEGPRGEIIHEFEYRDSWYPATDGFGFSLEVQNAGGPLAAWDMKAGWRASAQLGGSPGLANGPANGIPVILVNEALTHTDAPNVDAVELYNPNATNVNIGGWLLSDDFRTPKFQIPAGTIITAGGYVTFTEADFNVPGTSNAFNLRSSGDEVYLYSADLARNLTGYIHGHEFGASLNGVAFGRYITSTGREEFVAQSANSLNAPNVGPKVGPVVISEIMYHPPDLVVGNRVLSNDRDEFVELANLGGTTVPLYDPDYPTNTYRLRDAVSYAFPMGQSLPPNGRVVVVPFDPNVYKDVAAAFRAKYGISAAVPLYGPYEGRLANGGDSVELVQPDFVVFYGTNQVVTGVMVDQVEYEDEVPWPLAADGFGPSLQRIVGGSYGNDPTNWVAAVPTPGAAIASVPPPVITVNPVSQTVIAFNSVTMSVQATGAGTLSYQWLLNGDAVPGATSATLQIDRVLPDQGGVYQAIVFNAGGSALSAPATLNVLIPASILTQPQPKSVQVGESVLFTIAATSSSPITYQWRFNGVPIPGATGTSYSIPSAQRENDGVYDVVVTDAVGSILSNPVRLTVLVLPVIITVNTNYVAVEGSTVRLAVEADGTLPMSYRWRKGFSTVKLETSDSLISFLTLTNVQVADSSTSAFTAYSVVLTNVAFSTPGVLSPYIFLKVLADTDKDGMPDAWETANGFNPNDAGDADLDEDEDGMTNGDEFVANTNPNDANSYLKVERVTVDGDATIEFEAAAGISYTVQHKDSLDDPAWTKLSDVAASSDARAVVLRDREASPSRFYRLVTPVQP